MRQSNLKCQATNKREMSSGCFGCVFMFPMTWEFELLNDVHCSMDISIVHWIIISKKWKMYALIRTYILNCANAKLFHHRDIEFAYVSILIFMLFYHNVGVDSKCAIICVLFHIRLRFVLVWWFQQFTCSSPAVHVSQFHRLNSLREKFMSPHSMYSIKLNKLLCPFSRMKNQILPETYRNG